MTNSVERYIIELVTNNLSVKKIGHPWPHFGELMNIFKALSEGNGRISETNITSFMNFLLDSSNQLNNSLIILFLQLIDQNLTNNKILDYLSLDNINFRNLVNNFNNKYYASAEPELSITGENGSRQIPDIVVTVRDKESEDKLYIIIENKIKKSAKNDNQIKKQYEYVKKSDDFIDGIPIYNILITPEDDAFKTMYLNGVKYNSNTAWLNWYSQESTNSIVGIIQKLIKLERDADIQPIDLYSIYILKSFIDYLSTEFIDKTNSKKSFDIKGFKVMDEYFYKLESLYIRRYSNQMIRLFDSDENIQNIEVKPLLRKIINRENLDIKLHHNNGRLKTTQELGKEVIRKLNERNSG